MKLVAFDDHRPGLLVDGGVVPVDQLFDGNAAASGELMLELIAGFASLRDELERLERDGDRVPLDDVRLRAPIRRPGKILCARGNYREGSDREPWPLDLFLKSPEAVIGPGDTVVLPERQHRAFQHEAELAVVIGKEGYGFPASEAYDYVLGYTAFMDVSGRAGIGRADRATFLGKSYDTFAPMGPAIVTTDEISDPHTLRVRYWVSGEPRHDYSTDDMEHGIPELLEFAASVMTLLPGDVVTCGTNHQQVGPLQHGDVGEIEIERIGRFAVHVDDPLRRSWAREIDQEIASRVRKSLPAEDGDAAGASSQAGQSR